jgi:hypothetical protein
MRSRSFNRNPVPFVGLLLQRSEALTILEFPFCSGVSENAMKRMLPANTPRFGQHLS